MESASGWRPLLAVLWEELAERSFSDVSDAIVAIRFQELGCVWCIITDIDQRICPTMVVFLARRAQTFRILMVTSVATCQARTSPFTGVVRKAQTVVRLPCKRGDCAGQDQGVYSLPRSGCEQDCRHG